jgi:basic amino acid/polyamine antiporter, APA family
VKFGTLVQNIFSIAKISAMLLLMLGALFLPVATASVAHFTTPSATVHPAGIALFAAIAAALQGAFWAYDGWNKLTFIAGEVRQPQRNIPLSLLWGTLAVTALYVFVNVAYVYVLPIDAMAQSKLVAADVAGKMFDGGGRWISALVMVSTFGAANAIILTTARVYFSMAQHGAFPSALGRVHPRYRTPGASLVAQGVWSSLLLFSGTFDTLTDTLIFVAWVFYAAGAFGVFVLRRREPDTPRPYRVPGYPFVPAGFVLFALIFLGFTVYNDFKAYETLVAAGKPAMINTLFGLGLVFIGAPFYFLFRGRKSQADGADGNALP